MPGASFLHCRHSSRESGWDQTVTFQARHRRGAPDATELFLDCTGIWWWVVYIKSVLLKSTYKLHIYIYIYKSQNQSSAPTEFPCAGPAWANMVAPGHTGLFKYIFVEFEFNLN